MTTTKVNTRDELTLPDFDAPLTDEDLAQGFYFCDEMIRAGFIRDRTDLKRKQEKYRFPKPTKTGDRQAPTSKARVHAWLRWRDTLTH